ncbi:MAG: hypothetical protein SGARI_004256 [Bacillariaceae sp.]
MAFLSWSEYYAKALNSGPNATLWANIEAKLLKDVATVRKLDGPDDWIQAIKTKEEGDEPAVMLLPRGNKTKIWGVYGNQPSSAVHEIAKVKVAEAINFRFKSYPKWEEMMECKDTMEFETMSGTADASEIEVPMVMIIPVEAYVAAFGANDTTARGRAMAI